MAARTSQMLFGLHCLAVLSSLAWLPMHTSGIDASVRLPAGSWGREGVYLFEGDRWWVWSDSEKQVPSGEGYKKISEHWSGVPNLVDAALYWKDEGKLYFFKGMNYYEWNSASQKVDGGAKPIKNWASKLDKDFSEWGTHLAAVEWVNGVTYFFNWGWHYRYCSALGVCGSAPVSDWNGLPDSIDALFVDKDGLMYALRDNQHWIYHPTEETVLGGYPKTNEMFYPSAECTATGIYGYWNRIGFTSADSFTVEYFQGVSTSEERSLTEAYEHSVTVTVGAEYRFGASAPSAVEASATTSVEVSGSYASSSSSSVTQAFASDVSVTKTYTFNEAGVIWQWVFDVNDTCSGSMVQTDIVVVTPSVDKKPCCPPGVFANPKVEHGACIAKEVCTCAEAVCNASALNDEVTSGSPRAAWNSPRSWCLLLLLPAAALLGSAAGCAPGA